VHQKVNIFAEPIYKRVPNSIPTAFSKQSVKKKIESIVLITKFNESRGSDKEEDGQ
jgi:hypothetical protein